jgi:hypothetical protein
MSRTTPARAWRRRASLWRSGTTLFAATALFGATACSGADSATSPRPTNTAGLYALAQGTKKPVPFRILRGPFYVSELDDQKMREPGLTGTK